MIEKRRFLDIWIVESNTVYKEVPFAVVTDWVQQGRILEDDMWKPSGTRDWIRFGGAADFEPYFPRPEPNRVQDQAEALEPVHIEFTYKRPQEEVDEDVDMIPLIDVSLVLLVFFMLTATGAGLAAFVRSPETEHAQVVDRPDVLRIDIYPDPEGPKAPPLYAVGVGNKPATAEEKDLHTLTAALARLKVHLDRSDRPLEVEINADRDLPARVPRDVLMGLRAEAYRSKISKTYFRSSQRQP